MEKIDDNLLEALSILALHDLCAYIDIQGNPVMCDWEAYEKERQFEFNKYYLSQDQFNVICDYIKEKYKKNL